MIGEFAQRGIKPADLEKRHQQLSRVRHLGLDSIENSQLAMGQVLARDPTCVQESGRHRPVKGRRQGCLADKFIQNKFAVVLSVVPMT